MITLSNEDARKFLKKEIEANEVLNPIFEQENSDTVVIDALDSAAEEALDQIEDAETVDENSESRDSMVSHEWDVVKYFTVPESANRSESTFAFLAKSRDLDITSVQTGDRFFAGQQESRLTVNVARVNEETGELVGESSKVIAPDSEEMLKKEVENAILSHVGFRT